MKPPYLEKVYFKQRTPDSSIKFKKQQNHCTRLYKKEQKKYFQSLNPRRIGDNKRFWKIYNIFSLKNERLAIVNHGSKNILDQIGLIKFIKKAFESINHHLLIAKLGVFGFDTESLKLIKSY